MKYNVKKVSKQELNGCDWWNIACHAANIVGGTIHSAAVGFWNGLVHGYSW